MSRVRNMKRSLLPLATAVVIATSTVMPIREAYAWWHPAHFVLHLIWPSELDDPNELYGPWPAQ